MITYDEKKEYQYTYDDVQILDHYIIVDIEKYRFFNENGVMLNSYYKVLAFPSKYGYYYRFFFQNGTIRSYPNNYLTVDENALSNSSASPLFDYYRKAAECNDLRSDDGELILKRIYEGLHFISQSSILAAYLNRKAVKHFPYGMNVIFPFGCNMSQITANRQFCYIRAVLKPKNSSLSFLPIDLSSELCYNYYNKHIHSGGAP